jgi:phosphoribosylanthranilate isomerase
MPRVRVKVCCISSLEEARTAIAAGADALGLVGDMPAGGPGIIDAEQARSICAVVPPPVATFVLTSACMAAEIAEQTRYCGASAVQLVRHIDPAEYSGLIRRTAGRRRVQVIHVDASGALELVQAYRPFVHAFLLDSGRPGDELPVLGGTGRTHDWKLSAEIVARAERPVFLAGGLRAENVNRALATIKPFGVDLCSGVRSEGRLDTGNLERFMAAVRRAENRGGPALNPGKARGHA